MRPKECIIKIDVPIYNGSITFLIGQSLDKAVSMIKEKYPNSCFKLVDEDYTAGGITFLEFYPNTIIWIKHILDSPYDYAIFQHELSHAVIKIFEIVGMKINMETSEPYCYLYENLTEAFLEKYWELWP